MKWMSKIALATASALAGASVGILIYKLTPQSGMGFDGIADALGALFLGLVGGGLMGLLGSLFLSDRTNWIASAVALLVAVTIFWLAARSEQSRIAQPEARPPFEPAFVVQMFSRIAAGDPGPPPSVEGFPFRELRVSAHDWSLEAKGWGGPERRYCRGDLERDELERLAAVAGAMAAEGIRNCERSDAGSGLFSLTVEWEGQTTGVAMFGLHCQEQPAVTRFLDEFERVRSRLVADGTC